MRCYVGVGAEGSAVVLCTVDWVWCVGVVCVAVVGCWLIGRVDCVCAWCAYNLACFVFGFVAYFLCMCVIFVWDFLEWCSVCSIVCSVFLVFPCCIIFLSCSVCWDLFECFCW